jgi:type VI secretion system protein ImpK
MSLSALFVPLMAYVQGLERQQDPSASQVYEALQQQIKSAREHALDQSMDLPRFQEALFPVVAWVDERLSLMPAWQTTRAWRSYMLQRKLYATNLAGVQFFERLQNLAPDDSDLRELYVMCLALGFVGRYSQNPNNPELVALCQDNYKMLRPEWLLEGDRTLARLFPEAYRLQVGQRSRRNWHLGSKAFWLLIVVVPVVLIAGLVFWFDHLLSEQVAQITRRLP